MDHSSDDDIELLKVSPNGVKREEQVEEEENINPLFLLQRTSSTVDESVNAAPIHALQTAFTSLQKKHNEHAKRYQEIHQENKHLKQLINESNSLGKQHSIGDVGIRQFGNLSFNMDDCISSGLDPSLAFAAGGTSEDNSMAEQQAKDGMIRHLQKEILMKTNAIKKLTEDNYRSKYDFDELQKELKNCLMQIDHFQGDNERFRQHINELELELTKSQAEARHLHDKLRTVEQSEAKLRQDNVSLKQRLEQAEQVSRQQSGNTAEVSDLRTKLYKSNQEKQAFEARCKQLEIQAKIHSDNNHSLRQQDELDDVDGDLETLRNALQIVEQQRNEYEILMKKVTEQAEIIKQLTQSSRGGYRNGEVRIEAQGQSYHPYHDQLNDPHLYANGTHRSSGFYSGNPNSSTAYEPMLNRRNSDRSTQAARTSPRVEDNRLPTGNQSVAKMFAQEVSQPPVRRGSANVMDSRGLSPKQVREGDFLPEPNTYRGGASSSPRLQHSAADVRYVPVPNVNVMSSSGNASNLATVTNPSDGAFNNGVMNFNRDQTSPYSREGDGKNAYNGARPRVQHGSTGSMDMENGAVRSPHSSRGQQMPMRMTQSEIFQRDLSPCETPAMTRSVLDPLKPIVIPSQQNRNDAGYVHVTVSPQSEHISPNHSDKTSNRATKNGPDYENVYSPRPHTDMKAPPDEHEDTTFITCSKDDFVQLQPSDLRQETNSENVAALKICPVCNLECSRLTMEQFQMHVVECFDNGDESPATLQPAGQPAEDERTCPMCGQMFSLSVSQENYEKHVLGHFGEEPETDRFEIVPT